jgi:hypothetical protein
MPVLTYIELTGLHFKQADLTLKKINHAGNQGRDNTRETFSFFSLRAGPILIS